ncbi:reverse transcriptase domain-containing protein [Tanacetum coccineum]|uniref:Reverse transcriptase domain-containing protein n=1 Tax=Tanacetum coccineum TaxID=301880 RepID=A0ABQ5CCM2_9ASTR
MCTYEASRRAYQNRLSGCTSLQACGMERLPSSGSCLSHKAYWGLKQANFASLALADLVCRDISLGRKVQVRVQTKTPILSHIRKEGVDVISHYASNGETDIQEKEQKESQTQTIPSTEWKGQNQNSSSTTQARKRRQQQVQQTSVESSNLEKPDNPPIVTMADNRTMAQLLEAPTEGYEDAIVIPEITANNFEIKHGLLNLVQNKQFFGNDKEDPHAHIRYFNKITSTMKIPNVPNTSVKLMLFPFSLEGAARIWLEKEPPRSIETWDDLVMKFINKFFPPSKTTNLRNEITRFQQKFDETFCEAWDRFNDLLRGCPHHGFSKLHQLDTFYNALNSIDQDSLNSAAGGNFLDKMPRECLKIIESKSKVRQSRNKAVVAKMSTSSSTPAISSDVAELKDMVRALILDRKNQTPASAPVKAVEQSCVTCGGGHFYQNCPATNSNMFPRTNIQEYVSQAAAATSTKLIQVTNPSPAWVTNQFDLLVFPPIQNPHANSQINFNRGNNFNPKQGNNFNEGPKAVSHDTEVTKDTMPPANNGSTEDVQPPVVQIQSRNPNPEPNVSPETQKNSKLCEAKTVKSSIDKPPEVELKDLPPHLEYAFLEDDNKLPVIIAKELSLGEKADLIKVLKSHKRAIAWKLSDIQGINPEFCTHKILMEEDYKPTVQHQRRVNPKIHDVIKKEVEKLLDAGLIYPISDSPWVSPIHCVPKKGGFTVVQNEENELIPTRLVTGWRVCIDYRKLNEATRKDHFPYNVPLCRRLWIKMLEEIYRKRVLLFPDGYSFSGYFQIPHCPS